MLACVLLDDGDPALARRLFAVTPLLERVPGQTSGRSPSGDDDGGQLVFLDVRGTSRLHGGAAGLFAAVRRALAPVVPRGLALEMLGTDDRIIVAMPGERGEFLHPVDQPATIDL